MCILESYKLLFVITETLPEFISMVISDYFTQSSGKFLEINDNEP